MPASSEPTARLHEAMVVLPAHLHARPAGALVQAAARFSSTVEIPTRAGPSTRAACSPS